MAVVVVMMVGVVMMSFYKTPLGREATSRFLTLPSHVAVTRQFAQATPAAEEAMLVYKQILIQW